MNPLLGLLGRLFAPPAPAAIQALPRMDTTSEATALSGAAMFNPHSGLGSPDDSGASARPNLARQYLEMEELAALMRGGIYRRICEVVPTDALRRGVLVLDDTRRPNPLANEFREFEVLTRLHLAAIWGRGLGHAFLWPVVEDGGVPLSEPLDISRVTRLYSLQVLDQRDVTPMSYQSSYRSRQLIGRPETYLLAPSRPGLAMAPTTIHHSRLLPFWGDDLPGATVGTAFGAGWWADAVGQTIWDGLRNLQQTGAAGARLAQELSVAVFYLDKGEAKHSARGRDAFRAVWDRLMQVKSIAHALILGTNDKAERLQASPSGFDQISESQWQYLQATTGIPAARIRGMSPSGLSTDGDSWQQSYYADVGSWADRRILPALETLIRILYRHRDQREPAEWSVGFGPFYELSGKEEAELRLTTTQADQLAIEMGLVTREQVRRSRFGPGGWQAELQPATPEEEAALELGPDLDPAEAEAELARLTGQGEPQPAALTPDQVRLASELLRALSEGKATPDATRLLLEGVVPPERALALVEAQTALAPAIDQEVDAPDLGHQRRLAASLTEHQIDRCQHGSVNRCRLCGIEREREVVMGPDGKPQRGPDGTVLWRVAWRAIGEECPADPPDNPAATDARADADFGATALLSLTLSDAGRAAWQALRERVEAITGPLEGYGAGEPGVQEPPHVTVLYLGPTDAAALPEITARASTVVADYPPLPLVVRAIGSFPAGDDGRVPVVAHIDPWRLGELNDRLLRTLARHVHADQYDRFRPHVTFGYAATLTPEQIATLAELLPAEMPTRDQPSLGSVAALDLHHKNAVVARLPLAGRRYSDDRAPAQA